jgi:hypothetical protein
MNSTPFSSHDHFAKHFASAGIFRAALLSFTLVGAPALVRAVEIATPTPGPGAPVAPQVPNAATVPPAAIVEMPLPPAAGQEIEEPQPSPQHARVPGHWRWQEGHYAWIPTHWELPPVPNATWTDPRWEKRGNGYVLVEGFWQQGAAPAAVVAAPAPAPQTVVVDQPPPPPAPEVIVERPSATHVWISGYWRWHDGRHVWVAGHWEMPPRVGVVWVEPRWERRGNGYVFVEGYWGEAAPRVVDVRPGEEVVRESPEVVVIRTAPPAPRHEMRGPRPSPHHVWIDGYWASHGGRTVWVAGRWELPPRGHTAWVAPRWESRGGGYVFIEGGWR